MYDCLTAELCQTRTRSIKDHDQDHAWERTIQLDGCPRTTNANHRVSSMPKEVNRY